MVEEVAPAYLVSQKLVMTHFDPYLYFKNGTVEYATSHQDSFKLNYKGNIKSKYNLIGEEITYYFNFLLPGISGTMVEYLY